MSILEDERSLRRALRLCSAECALAEHMLNQLKAAPDTVSAYRLMSLALGDMRRAEAALHAVTSPPTNNQNVFNKPLGVLACAYRHIANRRL